MTAGIIAGQAVLYGPALVGAKILLPLGCLAEADKYIPQPKTGTPIASPQPLLLDLVTTFEPDRRFAAQELAAGRLPQWIPYRYGGVPFVWPRYSPILLLSAASASPVLVAWAQLVAALVAGLGAFAFCRRSLRLGYWPSAVASWCYPVTGWFVLFQGYATGLPVIWLPWLFLAIDAALGGARLGLIAVAVVTGLVAVTGSLDVAGQILLLSSLFSTWRVWNLHQPPWRWRPACVHGLKLMVAALLGLLLAAPYLLHTREYAKTSTRLTHRGAGAEERPPLGIVALPQIVLPDMYGSYAERGAAPLMVAAEGNQIESPAAGYTGLLATLLVAPFAFWSGRRRSTTLFFASLAAFGFAWTLNVPGVVHLLRLSGINLMSHNRLVFGGSFALLMLAAMGLEDLLGGHLRGRFSVVPQAVVLVGLLAWCLYRSTVLPEPLASVFAQKIAAGTPDYWVPDTQTLRQAQAWFSRGYDRAAVLCAAGLVVLAILRYWPAAYRKLLPVVAGLLVADLLAFGYGKRILQDPALYYPEIPALRAAALARPGRIIGIRCLPANLAQMVGFADVRGYDGFDPKDWLRLLSVAQAGDGWQLPYAATQHFVPRFKPLPPTQVLLPPVLSMLGVRYAVLRGAPGPELRPRFQSDDYWILENAAALPRAFVPERVQSVGNDDETLAGIGRADFDAGEVAYVAEPLQLGAPIRGSAVIVEDTPARIVVKADLLNPGLLVLADRWDLGWHAYIDGKATRIVRVNYALRGVVMPAGEGTVEFRYEPRSLAVGNSLALLAIALLIAWTAVLLWRGLTRYRMPAA